MFIMGRDTYCKQDVVDQNGDVSEREICLFSFVASVVNHQFLNPLVWPVVKHQLNSGRTKESGLVNRKHHVVPPCHIQSSCFSQKWKGNAVRYDLMSGNKLLFLPL